MAQSTLVGWLLIGLCWLGTAAPAAAQQSRSPERGFVLGGSGSRIGVSIRELRESDRAAAQLTRLEGVVIEAVQAGTPAERAGLRAGDVVVEFDNERVRGSRHFARLVQETPVGRTVQLVAHRNGARQTMSVTPEEGRLGSIDLEDLRERVERRIEDFPFGVGQRTLERRVGLTLTPLSDQLAAYFGVRGGVLVSEVAADSPAARGNLKAGDVITSVGGRAVTSPAEVAERLRATDAGSTVALTLMRDKQEVRTEVRLDAGRRPPARAIGI